MSNEANTLAIVEDDQALRESLSELIDTASKWQLVGAYPSASCSHLNIGNNL